MSGPHILLVEDDEFLIQALRALLLDEGYRVTEAPNGQVAQQLLLKEDFAAVLSDLQMPVVSGIELAKWTKQNRPLPFIMMTGFIESINTIAAVEMGAVNILYKPFGEEELLRALKAALGAGPGLEVGIDGNLRFKGFTQISTAALMPGAMAEFNLYRAIDGQLQKVVSLGEPYPMEELARLNLTQLYTESSNLSKLVPMSLMLTRAVGKSQMVDAKKKAVFIKQSIELIRQKFAVEGVDDELLETLRDLVSRAA